ncbi:hypothetical protein GCM10023107_59680 [Actinoplanes octamycinicus]|nr:hypothetical protein Aoc01nite_71410 [Actinoplanes octamycinicus]
MTVRDVAATAGGAGDPAYVVEVTVRVLRGSWEFGPGLVRLRYADGATEKGPVDGGGTPGARTLHAGVTRSWLVPFEHPAGAGVGTGAQVLIGAPDGAVLAWATR